MALDKPWIDVPKLLDDEQLASVQAAFSESGVVFSSEPIVVFEGKYLQEARHVIHVSRLWARQAAKILAETLELEDPADDTPFTGTCPSCGASVTKSWSCPSCDLGFHSRFDADDPMIVFVRNHGGFRRS